MITQCQPFSLFYFLMLPFTLFRSSTSELDLPLVADLSRQFLVSYAKLLPDEVGTSHKRLPHFHESLMHSKLLWRLKHL